MEKKRTERNKKKRRSNKKKKKNKILIVLGILLTVLITSIFGGYLYVTSLLNKMDRVDINEDNLGIDSDILKEHSGIENIALFGVDATEGEYGRSDSTMILTIDRKNKKVKITSLMRDCYVNIEGHGKDKLNHAYGYGGPELAIKTINKTFGLNIKDFATVNFTSLPKIIDILGGIDINLDEEEVREINPHIRHLNTLNKIEVSGISKAGTQRLNGIQALAYCRIRYTSGGDYKRTERQREVLEKLFEKALKMSPTKYPNLLNQVMPMVKTSLTTNEVLAIGTDMISMAKTLEQARYPEDVDGKESYIDKVYYLQFDEATTKNKMQNWIFKDIK